MRRRVRDSRGAKRRWSSHISSPWPKGRENKGDEVTVLTACGIETRFVLDLQCYCNQIVATVLTACGMRRRVRGSRGVKRRWGPHISSPWPKGRENKGDEATVLTACSIETYCTQQLHTCFHSSLQQYLPLAVLKLWKDTWSFRPLLTLQQYLPLAVLKRIGIRNIQIMC